MIATKLFGLANVIVESQITHANHIEEMYDTIAPETVKAQIEKRDAPKQIEADRALIDASVAFHIVEVCP